MFCKKCGNNVPEHATVCDSCNTRTKPGIFCHKCAAELPANSTRCVNCNAKSRAHKKAVHWLPLLLTLLAFIFYLFGGSYYQGIVPYTTPLDYLAVLTAIVAIIIAIVVIPRTRLVLKIISILLSGLMLYAAVSWVMNVILAWL